MKLETALKKTFDDANVNELLKKGYFLGSVFSICKSLDQNIEEWIFHFFNSKEKTVVDCFVNEEVTIGEETPAMSDLEEIKTDKVKISIEKAISTVKKKDKSRVVNVLITLHLKEKKLVWTINVITAGLTANTYDIDAVTGKMIDEKSTKLISSLPHFKGK